MKLMKKGSIGAAQAFIMGIAGIAITTAVVLIVLGELQGTTTENTAEYNATGSMITKVGTVPTWVGLLVVVFFAGLILSFFYMRN
jgi:type II secretory pathway component PulF